MVFQTDPRPSSWFVGFLTLLLLACFFLGAGDAYGQAYGATGEGVPGKHKQLVVAATSDIRGWVSRQILHPKSAVGLAHLSVVIEDLRHENPGLLLLDAGDAFRGSPMTLVALARGEPPPVLGMMARLGYDAAALGEHDLYYGLGRLRQWLGGGRGGFSWLSANVPGGEEIWLPYRIFHREGMRIAVLGLTTPGAKMPWENRAEKGAAGDQKAPLEIEDMEQAARKWLPRLRAQADVVVGLFHSGLNGSYNRNQALEKGHPLPNAAGRIADSLGGFDLIISGHAKKLFPRFPKQQDSAYKVPVLSAGKHGEALAVARLFLAPAPAGENAEGWRSRWKVVGVNRRSIMAASKPDSAWMWRLRKELQRTRDFIAEPSGLHFLKRAKKADLALCLNEVAHRAWMGRGGAASLLPLVLAPKRIRTGKKGEPLTRAHLLRWIPFDNQMVLARLKPRQIHLFLVPFSRWKKGRRVRPSLLVYPGGLESTPQNPLKSWGLPQKPTDFSPLVWMSGYHWQGGGGLASKALVHPSQKVKTSRGAFRETLFTALSNPLLPLPPLCRTFLKRPLINNLKKQQNKYTLKAE